MAYVVTKSQVSHAFSIETVKIQIICVLIDFVLISASEQDVREALNALRETASPLNDDSKPNYHFYFFKQLFFYS